MLQHQYATLTKALVKPYQLKQRIVLLRLVLQVNRVKYAQPTKKIKWKLDESKKTIDWIDEENFHVDITYLVFACIYGNVLVVHEF